MHYELKDGISKDFEMSENEETFLKVRIKNRPSPCVLIIKYQD